MKSLPTALVTLLCLCVGTILGSLIRGRLPERHILDDSRDVVKLASGMIATLVALVIGLLVNSSKSSYDQASAGVTQIGAKVIMLDRVLDRYGPETRPIRHRIGLAVANSIERLWPKDRGVDPSLAAIEESTGMDDVHDLIALLEPKDEMHRILRSHALTTSMELTQARWLIIEQAQVTLPVAFLGILMFWLTVLFASFGLLAPPNATTRGSLFICALSIAAAVYLILEMNRPLEGSVQISPAPMRKALSVIGKRAGGPRPENAGAGARK